MKSTQQERNKTQTSGKHLVDQNEIFHATHKHRRWLSSLWSWFQEVTQSTPSHLGKNMF